MKDMIYWREWDWQTSDQRVLLEMLATACDRMSWKFIPLHGLDPNITSMVRQASNAVIWNGSTPGSRFLVDMRRRLSMPTLTIEQGWLPQADNFGLDYNGIAGDSSLCNDSLDWVGVAEETLLERLREKYTPADWSPPKSQNGKTLLVGQLMKDSQVVGFTQYRSFDEFVADAIDQLGVDQITVRPHPLANDDQQIRDYCAARNIEISERGESFTDSLARHGSVYGINSTSLLEAALLDVPSMACGECALLSHQEDPDQVERLLAALASRQVPKDCNDVIPYLDAMSEFEIYSGVG